MVISLLQAVRVRVSASSESCCPGRRHLWGPTSSLPALGNLLFLSGTLPVVNGKLAISGRLGGNLSVKEGQEAAYIASLNALAAAMEHLGDLDQLKKLVKLTVLIATTEDFTEHAAVADGASELFVKLFSRETGHVRLVYGVQSLPVGAPVIVDVIFEIEPLAHSTSGR